MPNLLQISQNGLYCPQGDFYIDPWAPVNTAFISHAHGDHAKNGCLAYVAHKATAEILKIRMHSAITVQEVKFGESLYCNGVKVSFHPAGHIPGSSQIRVEYEGEVTVYSGDYKLNQDTISEDFEFIKCNTFITESTFGLPVFRWKSLPDIEEEIISWIKENNKNEVTSVLLGYSLGKAQRLIKIAVKSEIPVYVHSSILPITNKLIELGYSIPSISILPFEKQKDHPKGSVIIAPPNAFPSSWIKKYEPLSAAFASGWMSMRGAKRRKNIAKGFVISDHADWDELNLAIKETGAENIFVTHGYIDEFTRWLTEQGLNAKPLKTMYGVEESE